MGSLTAALGQSRKCLIYTAGASIQKIMKMRTFRKIIFNILFLSLSSVSTNVAKDFPTVDVEDLIVLLEAAYCKIEINGPPNSKFILTLEDSKEKSFAELQLQTGEEGSGLLTLLAKNKDNITGPGDSVSITYRWQAGAIAKVGKFSFQKFWSLKNRVITVSNGVIEGFSASGQIWNLETDLTSDVERIYSINSTGERELIGRLRLKTATDGGGAQH